MGQTKKPVRKLHGYRAWAGALLVLTACLVVLTVRSLRDQPSASTDEPPAVRTIVYQSPSRGKVGHGSGKSASAAVAHDQLGHDSSGSGVGRGLIEDVQPSDTTALLHARWSEEVQDPDWAPAFETGVAEIFTDPALEGAELISIDCRTTLCRVEVQYDSQATFDTMMRIGSVREPLAGASGSSSFEEHHFVTYLTPAALVQPG